MKKLFLVLATLGLALGSAYADYTILENELEPYAKLADVPTDVGDLNNDAGYITSEDVPTSVSELTNDVGYITSGDVPMAVGAFSNDVGYITASEVPAQVQSDWSETNSASPAYIDNKPALITSNEVSEIARRVAGEVVDEMTSVGWEVDGTWYKLVVQSVVPPPPAETTFTLEGGTEQTYDIAGALDGQWMINNELCNYDAVSGENEWLVTIESANIGTSVTSIGPSAFHQCRSLASVTIPNSVTNIGGSAFSSCSSLTSVTIPNSVTSIGNGAFYECSSLTSVTIPDSVTSISSYVFLECVGLTSVTIPGSVTSIGVGTFEDCNSLMSVMVSGKTTTQVSGMSNYPWELPSGCVITCSDGTITLP